MINAAPRGLAQCPWCTRRHLASFFYLPIQERETCTGLPSSGRTSRSTSDFGTHVGLERGAGGRGGWAQANQPGRRKPGLTFQLICSPLKHRDLKTHETGSKRNQLMFLCCSPTFPRPCTIGIRQHLLSSLHCCAPTSVLKNTTNTCFHKNPVTRQTQSTHTRKAKKSNFTYLAIILINISWYNTLKPKNKREERRGGGRVM